MSYSDHHRSFSSHYEPGNHNLVDYSCYLAVAILVCNSPSTALSHLPIVILPSSPCLNCRSTTPFLLPIALFLAFPRVQMLFRCPFPNSYRYSNPLFGFLTLFNCPFPLPIVVSCPFSAPYRHFAALSHSQSSLRCQFLVYKRSFATISGS